ncbi:MAG: 4Fe-4S binding protein [Candidatus Omnitrophota bacterium]|jgi:polyferredoxin
MQNILMWAVLVLAFLGMVWLVLKRWIIPARGFVQLSVLTLSEISFICNKGLPCSNCFLSFGICPIGTLQRVAFIPTFPLLLTLGFVGLMGVVLGTLSCGWCCPVGFIQDILSASRGKKMNLPQRISKIRFLIFILVVVLISLELKVNFFSSRGIGIFHELVIFSGALLLLSALFMKRPLCRFLCPLGFIYGKLNRLSIVKAVLNKDKCLACGACKKACISDLDPLQEANNEVCVKCFNCARVCRQKTRQGEK